MGAVLLVELVEENNQDKVSLQNIFFYMTVDSFFSVFFFHKEQTEPITNSEIN